MTQVENILFSGIQPTGAIHLGNYLGAINHYLKIQKFYSQAFFCVVDLHAITNNHSPTILKKDILNTFIIYLACGLDPTKTILFAQSAIPAHSELAWILSCNTPIGWLNRMIQFKEKSQNKANPSVGLYTYPILMAADILIYRATHVPVGTDQKQHLELARDIALHFNHYFHTNFLITPECLTSEAPKVMSLKDGTKKMSKSDAAENARINLTDNPDQIKKKIQGAKSDSILGFEYETVAERPEAYNLLKIYSVLSNIPLLQACNQFNSFSSLKATLTETIINYLQPIQAKISELQKDLAYIKSIIKQGNETAFSIATSNLQKIKQIIGL